MQEIERGNEFGAPRENLGCVVRNNTHKWLSDLMERYDSEKVRTAVRFCPWPPNLIKKLQVFFT